MIRSPLHLLLAAMLPAALVAAPAQAQPAYELPPARIVVSGDGIVNAAPDYASITIGVTTNGANAKAATNGNSQLMTAVQAALRGAGIEQKDIQTARFSVQPVYAPAQANAPPKLSGFSVTNEVAVTVRQIDRVGDILDGAVAVGANDIGGVQFLLWDPSKTLDPARTAAVADARRKAELYARAAGLVLGNVVWITEDQGFGPAPRFQAMRAAAPAAAVPITAGEETLHVHVTVGFDVAH